MTSPAPSAKPAAACGCGESQPFDGATPEYRRVLAWVIAINLIGFVVVASGGLLAGSASLAANALDFLADAATYALSLWVIGKSVSIRSGAALVKGASLSILGVSVLGFAIWRAVTGVPPEGLAISGLGLFGAAANLVAAILLSKYRDGDANVRSVWLCSRNDAIGNVAVMIAALGVWGTATAWPDLAVAAIMAGLFLTSSVKILRQAWQEYRSGETTARSEAHHGHDHDHDHDHAHDDCCGQSHAPAPAAAHSHSH